MAKDEFPKGLSEATARGLVHDLAAGLKPQRRARRNASGSTGSADLLSPLAAAQSRRPRRPRVGLASERRQDRRRQGRPMPPAASDLSRGAAVSDGPRVRPSRRAARSGAQGRRGQPGRRAEAGGGGELHRRPRRRRSDRDTGLVGRARGGVHHLFERIQDRLAGSQRGRGRDVRSGVDRRRLGDGAGRA